MLAFFERQWIPIKENPAPQVGRDQIGFILSGDTAEDLAWDLVEMYFNSSGGHEALRGSGVGEMYVLSRESVFPSLTYTLSYHEARFTDDWWRRQQWMMVDFLGGELANGLTIDRFKTLFPAETLLVIYLTVMIGRCFSKYHGAPDGALNPDLAIKWFEELGYLQWLEVNDPKVLGGISLG